VLLGLLKLVWFLVDESFTSSLSIRLIEAEASRELRTEVSMHT